MGKGFNNYMTKKFFHPGSKENIKRVWMAEQKSVFDKKKQEEMLAQYQREQEMYGNRALLGDEKAKLGLSFMYDPPPGAKKEHVKEDDEPEYKFEWQRKFNAPREKYAKDDDTIRDQPFGIEVRNVRCIKCHKWGHVNTDKICPLFGKNITAEPPQPGMAPKSLMDGMKEDGLAIRSSLLGKRLNPDNPNEQILAEADEDDPEVQFLKSLTSKQKKKLLKKLDKLAKQQAGEKDKRKKKKKKHRKESDSDDDGQRESKKNKKKKKREEASSDSGDSSSDSDSEPSSKKYKREISKSEYRKGEKESKDQKRPYESHREWSSYEDKLRHEHTRQKRVSPLNEPHADRSRKGERSRENSHQDYRRSKSPNRDSRRDWDQRPRHPSHYNQRRSEWDDHRDAGNRGREKHSGRRDSPERLKEDNLRQKYSDRPGYSGDSTKPRTRGRSGGKTGKPRSRHDSSSSSGSDSSSSESSPERPSRRRPRHDSSDSDDSPVHHKKGIGAKSSAAASHRSRNRDRSKSRSRSTERYRKHSSSPSRTDKHKRHGREKNIHRRRSSSRE